jgi:hypothetical protein
MEKTYLYLVKIDKSDIKVLCILEGNTLLFRHNLESLKALKLPPGIEQKIESLFLKDWELWMESASNYVELENKLYSRGIKIVSSGIPICSNEIIKTDLPVKKKSNSMVRRLV